MYDLKHVVDFIFKDKENYEKLSDKDKEDMFFIINRKFSRGLPQHSFFFNKKHIDKSSAMDMWYYFFIKKRVQGIPQWYWSKKQEPIKKINIPYKKNEIEFLIKFHDITIDDIEYLVKYYPEQIDEEVKKYRKFNKND